MKNFFKIFSIALFTLTISCKAQQTSAFKTELKNNIEAKKSLYIGKTINNLLTNISYPVRSYMSSSFTGKTNSVALYFISNSQIREINKTPITLIIYFTQEKDIKVIDDMLRRNQLNWTAEEKAYFGNLIVKDIYIGGNP